MPEHARYEIIGVSEISRRWGVSKSWIYERTRARCLDRIPTVLAAKEVLVAWGSPALEAWWQRQIARGRPVRKHKASKQQKEGESNRKEVA